MHQQTTQFPKPERTNKHIPVVGPINEPKYLCNICPSKFDTFSKLQTHKCRSHKIIDPIREAITTNKCIFCHNIFKSIKYTKTHAQNCSNKFPPTEVEHILSQVPPAQSSSFSVPAQDIPAKSNFISFISPSKVTINTEPMYIETSPRQLTTEPTAANTETKVQTNLLQNFNTTATIKTSSPRTISYSNMGSTPNQRIGNWLLQLSPTITRNSPNNPAIT